MVEGIELRNSHIERADAFPHAESNISTNDNGKMVETSPESMTMARHTLICYSNSGDPIGLSKYFFLKSMVNKRYKVRKPNA